MLTDTDLRDMSLEVHPDANFTAVSDSCMSGGLIEGAQEQVGDSTWTPIVNSWEWGLLEERRTTRILQGKSPRLGVLRSVSPSVFQPWRCKKGTFHYCIHSCSPPIKWKHHQRMIDKWHSRNFSWGTKERSTTHLITTSWTILFR